VPCLWGAVRRKCWSANSRAIHSFPRIWCRAKPLQPEPERSQSTCIRDHSGRCSAALGGSPCHRRTGPDKCWSSNPRARPASPIRAVGRNCGSPKPRTRATLTMQRCRQELLPSPDALLVSGRDIPVSRWDQHFLPTQQDARSETPFMLRRDQQLPRPEQKARPRHRDAPTGPTIPADTAGGAHGEPPTLPADSPLRSIPPSRASLPRAGPPRHPR
jgi:hypothetical protein